MAKDFSSVTPQSVSGNKAPFKAPSGKAAEPATPGSSSNRRKQVVYAVGAVIVVALVVLVIGLLTRGGGDEDGAAPQAPHGPSQIVDGVPSGYTRDQGGAATAAVNFLQADDKAMAGQVDIAAVEKALVAENPGPKLVSILDSARGRQATGDTFTTLPATVTVRTLSQEAADVSVWALGSGSLNSNGAGDKSSVATWGTADLHLVWADDDWKVQDYSFRVGPQPGQESTSGADSSQIESGYYSFFVN
ncbi:MAG: hypothetical protein ACRDTD_32575 [Pseudonocardiaceae bacterium]